MKREMKRSEKKTKQANSVETKSDERFKWCGGGGVERRGSKK